MTLFDTALEADLQTLQHAIEYEGQNFRERDATVIHCCTAPCVRAALQKWLT